MSQDKFPHPTNTWIEEDVQMPVFTPEVNEAEGRVEFTQTKKTVKQRTFYADSPSKRIVCSNHSYVPEYLPKSLFRCTKCDWHRIAPVITYKYDPEKKTLSRRDTGEVI